ncbi:Hypothetical protein FKW44_014768 [Caligus rogercresseyi]|uniref:Uncharacterized protein n=1 Tax=Caligus rogercresseyi TaxID=217165 RepID=A0A7T8GZB5_CALRO|nr:Hypothetical protein FKW44_014768 [Caligus rogercresseyi]
MSILKVAGVHMETDNFAWRIHKKATDDLISDRISTMRSIKRSVDQEDLNRRRHYDERDEKWPVIEEV